MTMRFEEEKNEAKKHHTVRLKQKKDAMTLKLQKMEQEKTAVLVQKQSEQMLELLKAKQEEVKKELTMEIVSQFSLYRTKNLGRIMPVFASSTTHLILAPMDESIFIIHNRFINLF